MIIRSTSPPTFKPPVAVPEPKPIIRSTSPPTSKPPIPKPPLIKPNVILGAARRRLVSLPPTFRPGQHGVQITRGGGGPENVGARSSSKVAITIRNQGQPPHTTEADGYDEYQSYAAPSNTPNLAGVPANNFRQLGDVYGGRQ
jgi:hypothetical protein